MRCAKESFFVDVHHSSAHFCGCYRVVEFAITINQRAQQLNIRIKLFKGHQIEKDVVTDIISVKEIPLWISCRRVHPVVFFLRTRLETGAPRKEKMRHADVQPIGRRHRKPLSGDENAEEKHEIVAIDVRFLHTCAAAACVSARALAKHIKRSHT